MEDLQKLVDELQKTNSINNKKIILVKYPECKELLNLIYSKFIQFHITTKNIIKMEGKLDNIKYIDCVSLSHLLELLSSKLISGYKSIKTTQMFIKKFPEYRTLILNSIDKNLKCRIDTKLINKVWKDCVKTWNVALANSYDKLSKSAIPNFKKDKWFLSRKIDGVRCICIKKGDHVNFYSRTGKEYKTLDVIRDRILRLPFENLVLDGEICLFKNGIDDFQGLMKEIRKKNHTIKSPKFLIFDILSPESFFIGRSIEKLDERLDRLKHVLGFLRGNNIEIVNQTLIDGNFNIDKLLKEVDGKGWEGLMLRKNVEYKGKRGNDLVKCKLFSDAEYEVVGVESGDMRHCVVNSKGEKIEIEEEMLTSVVIKHKGYKVNVGSGFSITERLMFFNNPDLILNKIITVKYKKETINKKKEISLQFPIVKILHGIKRTI
jgi:DNA ligase 1